MLTWGRVWLAVACALGLAAGAPVLATAQPAQPTILIRELVVEGNRRVQEAVILGRVKSTVGGPFNPSQLSDDVRAVFGLGFFDDVQLRVEDFEGGVKVTVIVMERPFVRDIDFVGNRNVTTTELGDKIDLKLGSVYNPVDVERARQRLKDHYEDEGYFEVQITPDVEKFGDGDVKVVFNIVEGRRMKIDRIVIRGNKGLSDREIKKAMATKERTFWILPARLQRQRVDEDVERILALYNDHGYIQARVESHDIGVDRENALVTLTFSVVEGPQYHVGEIALAGISLFPESEVRRQLRLKAGDVFNRSRLRDSMREITNLYGTIGRSAVEVTPRTEQVPGNRVNVTLDIAEGPEVYVERINIAGNLRSQDKILRREIQMVEGDLFTLQKLQRSRQRLVNLGYFEKVEVSTTPGSDRTKIVVNVDVTEKPTGLFSIGGGYSSVDDLVGTIDLSQNNFLGRGWQAAVRIRVGGNSQQGVLSFTEPWLFDRPLSFGVDLFNTRRAYVEYDYDSLGGSMRLSHPFAEYWRWHLGYSLRRDEVRDIQEELTGPIRDEAGSRITSLNSAALTRDSRDNVISPTRGGQTQLLFDFAGLGGDSRFVKTVANTSYYYPIWFGHVLSGRAEVGYGFGWSDEPLPVFERFYLGGPNSIRSVKSRRISPVDDAGVRIGGHTQLLGNVEYIIPLPFNIRFAGFFDIGNVWGYTTKFDPTDTREAAGAGVRWLSPFGPIRFDYGVNLDRRKNEDFGAFHFSVGTPF